MDNPHPQSINYPSNYLDWGDVTRQVDPMGFKAWIHDGKHDIHAFSEARGHQFDKRDFLAIQDLLTKQESERPGTLFVPQAVGIRSYEYSSNCNGEGDWHNYRGVTKNKADGLLPSITRLLYEGQLGDKSTKNIEAEIREADRHISKRFHDRSGHKGSVYNPK